MTVSRRALLASAAPFALAGCAGGVTWDKVITVFDKVPEIVDSAKTIADALVKVMPAITGAVGIGTAAADKVAKAIQMVKDGAAAISSGGGGLIADGVTYLTSALTGYKLPAWAQTVVRAAVAALPALGINIPMAAGGDGGMTPQQALAVLRAA